MINNHPIGLKLWSTNKNYLNEAIRLYNNKTYDYIELYAEPNSLTTIPLWKNLSVPYIVHAPHSTDRLDFSEPDKNNYNIKLIKETIRFADELNSKYIIIHPGIRGNIENTIEQIINISDDRFLLENMPYFTIDSKNICIGSTYEDLKYIIQITKVKFCLDIGHAICSANSTKINPLLYIQKLLTLSPIIIHLSDGDYKGIIDKHLTVEKGNFPFNKILNLISLYNSKVKITVETEKGHKYNLDSFQTDVNNLKKLNLL